MANTERRPDPDAMLERARSEEAARKQGRLKVFIGFAPGVGKTFAMLEAARAQVADGRDVVIGWIETHGRPETEAMARGFERLAPRLLPYEGRTLAEFDCEAMLARRPALALIDEYAHANVPGTRHARRWQDVQDLLDAGIDVWTTLNVQHILSLNDVVAQITGIRVRETIPDTAFDRADEIELVDLPPDDLLRRLREGKIYGGEQAERAVDNFFRKGNLIALRELAMRRAAERVDQQASTYKIEQGIAQPWATSERLLVAISPSPHSASLLRAAYRMASGLRAPWLALSVETADSERLSHADRDRLASNIDLAERLGAETITVTGDDAAAEILAVANARNVTRIIVGKPGSVRGRGAGVLVRDLIARSGSIDVLVTAGDDASEPPAAPVAHERGFRFADYAIAAGAVAVATGIGLLGRPILNIADHAMIYVLAILFVSSRTSRGPSLLSSLASVAAFDFFFVEPFLTFDVADLRHLVTFGVLTLTGLMVSGLTARVRAQAQTAREREHRTAALYAMSRDFAASRDCAGIAAAAARHLSEMFDTTVTMALADARGNLDSESDGSRDATVARWVFEHGRPAGAGTETLPGGTDLFLPLAGATRSLGVVAVALGARATGFTPSQRQLLDNAVRQTALAIERARLDEEAAAARLTAESERLRNDLLSSVSHDLRTPLAAITGAATTLADATEPASAEVRRDLAESIRDQAERLERLVHNLLELTRIQSGAMTVRRQWCPLEEIIAGARRRVDSVMGRRDVAVDVPSDVLLIHADPTLIEQVLVNLLENAAKFTSPQAHVVIRGVRDARDVVVTVADDGPGIAPGDEERIFDRFHRGVGAERARGAGLGLTVSRAIASIHGGTLTGSNRPTNGAVFTLTIPDGEGCEDPAPQGDEGEMAP